MMGVFVSELSEWGVEWGVLSVELNEKCEC